MKKILVVGKDPKVSEDLRKYFDPQEYKLLSSCDAKNAISSVINLKPDLIILNLSYGSKFGNLHDHSGIEVLKKLQESNSNIPIIAITDSSSNLTKMDIIKEKVYAFVKTPIQPEKFSCIVREALSTGMHRTVHPTGESQMAHISATTERDKKELKELTKYSAQSEVPEKVRIDGSTALTINCEKIPEGYLGGKKDYEQMFDQLLTPIYEKIMVNSKGNIYDRLVSGLEKSLISITLKYCNHNQVKASQALGISRNTLRERIKRYDLW
jgi:DNA-binding NtrC family response regulator